MANGNKLMINSMKTMILRTLRYINSTECEVLSRIFDHTFSDTVEYLGVFTITNLLWDKQISKTISKVNSALYQFL